jgi:hypothetical protein
MHHSTLLAGKHIFDNAYVAQDVAEEQPPQIDSNLTTVGLAELLLKDPAAVDRLNGQPTLQRELFPRFLAIALTTYLVFSVAMVALLSLCPVQLGLFGLPLPPANWQDGTAWSLPLAYTISVVLAACVCLPSFYFYSLLAGLRTSWLQIVSLVGKGMAANSIMLLGILPIYVAVMLGLVVFKAPPDFLQTGLIVGLLLPFASGLWGLRAIYLGTMSLFDSQAAREPCERRCFLRRLTLSWAAVYTAVLPIMIYRLWEFFARQ